MNREEAERILTALKSGTPLISRHKAAEALEWALDRVLVDQCPTSGTGNHLYSHEKQGCFYCGAATGIAGPGVSDSPNDGTIILDRWVSGTVMSARGESDE